jgi:hypothetical protein
MGFKINTTKGAVFEFLYSEYKWPYAFPLYYNMLKAISLQAWTGPEGSRKLRLPEFLENRRLNVARLSALRTGRQCCCMHNIEKHAMTTICYSYVLVTFGRAIAQPVSRRLPTSEARFRSWVSSCGICGGQRGTGTGFSTSTSVFPCQFHSTGAPLQGKTKTLIIFITGLHNKP